MQLRGEGLGGSSGGIEEEANLSGRSLSAEALSKVDGGSCATSDGGQIGESGEGEQARGVVKAES